MKIITDKTPTDADSCMFGVEPYFCEVHSGFRYCVPMLMNYKEKCPYCIGLNDFLCSTAKSINDSRTEGDCDT